MESYEIAISENMKTEFKTWFKKYQKQLRLKHQSLKSRLKIKQARNNELKLKIDKLMESSQDTSMIMADAIPNKAQTNIQEGVEYLKTKSTQLKNCNQAMDTRAKEETKKIRQKLCDIITQDKISLKPFHEVEDCIKQLTLNMENCLRKHNAEKELYIETLKSRAQDFLQIKEDISKLEPIEQEIRLEIQKSNKILKDKMKSLQLQNISEATKDSLQVKELLEDIKKLETQLNK